MKSPIDLRIVLASNSPRRRQLLGYIIDDFDIAPSRNIDESYPIDLAPVDVAPYISRVKAQGYGDLAVMDNLVLTADTVVILNDQILGKPKNESEAIDMLMRIQGKTHDVVTGVTLHSVDKIETFAEKTRVHFGPVSEEDIHQYVEQFQPLDKAGAYGIQEWIGCIGIRSIEGCFYNVMGLPLQTLYQHLRKF